MVTNSPAFRVLHTLFWQFTRTFYVTWRVHAFSVSTRDHTQSSYLCAMGFLLVYGRIRIFGSFGFYDLSISGLTLEGEVGEEVAFWAFTSLYKSLRAKLKSLCKFEKSLCEFVTSLESRCKFHDFEEIIRKFLHSGAEYCQFPFIFSEISSWKV